MTKIVYSLDGIHIHKCFQAEGNVGDVDFDDISDYFGGGND